MCAGDRSPESKLGHNSAGVNAVFTGGHRGSADSAHGDGDSGREDEAQAPLQAKGEGAGMWFRKHFSSMPLRMVIVTSGRKKVNVADLNV